jgi:hypothetical protein
MRKIIPKEIEEKRKKRNQIILGFFLVLVLIISSISFALQGGFGNTNTQQDNLSGNEVDYNGFKFTNQNGLWAFGNYVFRYLPGEVMDLGSGINPIINYQGKPVYVYSEDESTTIDLVVNLGQAAQRVQKACPEATNCSSDLPVKTCSDNFIIIGEDTQNSITQKDNCVFIRGQKEDLPKLVDNFLFKALGVK